MLPQRDVRGGKPSPYTEFGARIPFHVLRSAQLLGAVVVSGIMAYFIDHLKDEHYPIPWTFIILLTGSLSTIVALTVTIVLYNFTYLSPRFNLILNGSISAGWALGLALLTWSISGTQVLQKSCSTFGGDVATGVCREYKSLWASTLCGTVSTIFAVLLDAFIVRKEARLGNYGRTIEDQDLQKLKDIGRTQGGRGRYEAPEEHDEQADYHTNAWDHDTMYHSGYGAQEPMGPLDSTSGNTGGVYTDRV